MAKIARYHPLIVEAAENRALRRVWSSLALDVRTRVSMDLLASVDPIALAKEHEAIAAALDRGDGKQAGTLSASHANHLVSYLPEEIEKQEKRGKRVVVRGNGWQVSHSGESPQ